uniref:Neuropeptide-like 1 n=1 Tax=Grapholita molesta TaxID=192188 RepID=A0A7D7PBC5_GRAMO|nr:neuropeptide-like precursor 1 [Grapholita molesta]
MRECRGMSTARHRGCLLLVAAVVLTFSSYIEQVVSMPAFPAPNQWPTFPRRNIAALARAGYLRGSSAATFKRSISTLAKNGMLPTFRAPYDEADKQDDDEGESHEKRNLASIARLRSYSAMKRNIQALARDGGYRGNGRAQYSQQTDKRNVAALARNGMIHLHKKDVPSGDEHYFPFYQNPVEPLSDTDGPFNANEIYDWQQFVNPDMFPPLSQVYKRGGPMPQSEYENAEENGYAGYGYPAEMDDNWYFKRGSAGLPVLGMYRPTIGDQSTRTKRYILSLPDVIDRNDIQDSEINENEDKRSVGSIPLTRISELGNISLVPKLSQSIQTTPTYRRRQYLLTRTRPAASSTDR